MDHMQLSWNEKTKKLPELSFSNKHIDRKVNWKTQEGNCKFTRWCVTLLKWKDESVQFGFTDVRMSCNNHCLALRWGFFWLRIVSTDRIVSYPTSEWQKWKALFGWTSPPSGLTTSPSYNFLNLCFSTQIRSGYNYLSHLLQLILQRVLGGRERIPADVAQLCSLQIKTVPWRRTQVCLQVWSLQTGRGLLQMRDLTFHLKACKKSHWQQISIRLPEVWYATRVLCWEANMKHGADREEAPGFRVWQQVRGWLSLIHRPG